LSSVPQWGAGWIALPDGGAIWRPDLRPCGGCGRPIFVVVRIDWLGGTRITVRCPSCCRSKDTDVVIGTLNTLDGRLSLNARARARKESCPVSSS
jgi:hypothetical protein